MRSQIYVTLEPHIDEGQGALEKVKRKGGGRESKRRVKGVGKKRERGGEGGKRRKTSLFRQRRVWIGHFGTFWDNLEDFATSLEHLDCFPRHFRPFFPIIGLLKKMRSGRKEGPTDGPTLL